jgi:hypothetical protein
VRSGAKTAAPAPQDRSMWRLLLRRCHPDQGGSNELFVWAQSLRDFVGSDAPEEPPQRSSTRRDPSEARHHSTSSSADRIRLDADASFAGLTQRALRVAEELHDPYRTLLFLLADCVEVAPNERTLWRQQGQAATYRSLAALAYRADMSQSERIQLYKIAEQIGLRQRHVGHLIAKLDY